MKKKVFLLWLLLLSILPLSVWSQEAYVVYSQDQTTLTFYYDNNLDSRKENAFAVYPLESYSANWLVNEEEYDYEVGFFDDEGNWYEEWLTDYRRKKITSVIFDSSFENVRPTTLDNWFYGLENLSSIQGLEYLNTTEVTNMSHLFAYCSTLKELNLSHFNTSKVVSMYGMFWGCTALENLDLNSFDTSNVTSMADMFNECSSLKTVNLSSFNNLKVTSMNYMFYGCDKLERINFNNFNTSNVKTMGCMFSGCGSLESLDLSSFNTSNVTSMWSMFKGCQKLERLDLSNFDTSKVTDMSDMFYSCHNLKSLNLSSFNTSNVTSMRSVFYGCNKLERLDLSNFDTSKVTNMSSMFSTCYNLKSLNLSSFNTSNVTSMSGMFGGCSSLTNLNVSNFNTSKVRTMDYMFNGDCSLTAIKLDKFNTNNVTSMFFMFSGCSKLKSLDLSNFNLTSATETSNMLSGCIGIENLMLSASMENVEGNAFNGIGTVDIPCNIYVPEGFDFGMDTTAPYFYWKGGFFALNNDQPNIVYCTDLSLYNDVIYIENATVRKGTQFCLSVKMNNVTPVRGFQFDLVLPDGVTIATDEDGELLVQLSTERTTKRKMNFFDSALQDDGSLRVLCNSTGGYTFDGNSGEVCTIIVDVAQGISSGDHALVLQNVIYTDVNAKKYEVGDDVVSKMTVTHVDVGDVNGDGEVDVADAAMIANIILGRDVSNINFEDFDIDCDGIVSVTDIVLLINIIMTGNANGMARVNAVAQPGLVEMTMPDVAVSAGDCVELPLLLANFSSPVVAWQGDLILPQGVYVQSIRLDEARRSDHIIDWEVNPDGRVRLLCMSMTNQSLEGMEGEVAYVTLRTDKNITPGIYELQLDNLVMASIQGGVTPDKVKASLLVNIPTTINNIEKISDGDMDFFGVNGAIINNGQKGLRIIRDQYGNVRKESVK